MRTEFTGFLGKKEDATIAERTGSVVRTVMEGYWLRRGDRRFRREARA
jgi:hypothetical protein